MEKQSKGKKKKKFFLLGFILFGPSLIFFLLSLGYCEKVFDRLPKYAEMPEYSFVDIFGQEVNNQTQKGKITIFSTIQATCPIDCSTDFFRMNHQLFQYYRQYQRTLSHVQLISIMTDKDGNPVDTFDEIDFTLNDMVEKYNPKIWRIVKGDPKQVFNVESNGINLYTVKDTVDNFGFPYFMTTLLLVDKDNQLRYFGTGKREGYVRDFKKKVALLQQEYDTEENRERAGFKKGD